MSRRSTSKKNVCVTKKMCLSYIYQLLTYFFWEEKMAAKKKATKKATKKAAKKATKKKAKKK